MRAEVYKVLNMALLYAIFFVAPGLVSAKPAHKKAMEDYFGPFLAKQLNDCRTCHVPDPSGQPKQDFSSDKPHNPFGERLKEVRRQLKKKGKKTDIPTRLEEIANEDSDGDGVSNLIELLSGHNPGEPDDKPTPDEVAAAVRKVELFRKHRQASAWSPFDAVQRRPVPKIKNASWVRNPIDAFLGADHESRGLKPRPEAPKPILLRRVYLDLIGLPPTREEMHAFLGDDSPDAYEKVVDKLLASPRYGERWGRHWMDVWRYSDWAGFGMEVRDSQRHIWHWRDWIIESLNNDKGYDRMVQEMLAGDELAPDDPDTLRATGFLARNWYKFNRNSWLENTVEHTGKAFLGVTLNCAKCHDHFFDPFTQEEYYQFRAIFEPHDVRIDRVPGQPDLVKDGLPRVYDANLETPTYLFVRGNDKNPDKTKGIVPGVPAVLGGGPLPAVRMSLPLTAHCPDKRAFVISESLAAAKTDRIQALFKLRDARSQVLAVAIKGVGRAVDTIAAISILQESRERYARAELEGQLAEAKQMALESLIRVEALEDSGKKGSPEWTRAATEAAGRQQRTAVLMARHELTLARQELGSAAAKDKVEAVKKVAAAEKAVAKAEAEVKPPSAEGYQRRALTTYPAASSGRRLALAQWITDKRNPLAARVAMNHLWLRHFGKAIVPTVFDFGHNGQPPTNAALLDWLAAEFMDRGWKMKTMHRLMVSSNAYRMDSSRNPADVAIDPDNRFFWRMNVRRMEAEVIRDSVLYAAGRLDLTTGGPDIDQHLGLSSMRRSLYFRHAPEKEMEFLALFDSANVTECYQRTESVIPQQALALANSSLVVVQSRILAGNLARACGGTSHQPSASVFVNAAFEEVLGRPPTSLEQSECEKFLSVQSVLLANPKKLSPFATGAVSIVAPAADAGSRARENLIQVLMNHNDFVTIR